MLLGQVAGKVWATKKSPALTGQAFLTVRVGERLLVCADCVGAGEGETVLIATGGAARLVEPLLRHAHTHDPEMLTLGLAYLYDRNRAQCPLANEEAE